MMVFTDDDLKRLRFALDNSAPNWVDKDNLMGLLARLEAAERVIATEPNWIGPGRTAYNAWRKACGRE